MQKFITIILAAGKGTRMKSSMHKVLHPVASRPLILHQMDQLSKVSPTRTIVVVGALQEQVKAAVSGAEFVTQDKQQGTGHAVLCAVSRMKDISGDIMVLYADVPFIPATILEKMLLARKGPDNPGIALLGFKSQNPGAYGRIVTTPDGNVERIVEYKDASPQEKLIDLCNSGVMVIDGALAKTWLEQIDNKNAAGEYYLTDLVEIAAKDRRKTVLVTAEESDVMGINSRRDLAAAEKHCQNKLRSAMLDNGVTMQDPDSVFFAYDTEIENDVIIEPHVVFGPGVKIASGSQIKAFSHIEGATVGAGATVGPFARLRPGTIISDDGKVGNFVEIKKSTLSKGVKVSHLSYIGDTDIGAGTNIGAGTITCNYDGFNKFQTHIGANVFVGSNTSLVAPVDIGDGAMIGAGSVITTNVDKDSLAVTRAKRREKKDGARLFKERSRKQKSKD